MTSGYSYQDPAANLADDQNYTYQVTAVDDEGGEGPACDTLGVEWQGPTNGVWTGSTHGDGNVMVTTAYEIMGRVDGNDLKLIIRDAEGNLVDYNSTDRDNDWDV